ncbi:MAG: hypothetical protein Q9180_008070, partial [Flavoplaca navasiana]
ALASSSLRNLFHPSQTNCQMENTVGFQPYLSADVAVLLEILKSPSRSLQPSVVPGFTANLAEKRQDGERKNLTENELNENSIAGGVALKPPAFFTGKTFFRHPSTARARNFAGSSRKQKKIKRRTRDKKRKVDEETAVQIEAETLVEGTPITRTSVADSEGIPASAKRARFMPNSNDRLPSAMASTETAVPHDINADVDIGYKDRAYERVISRMCSAYIDAKICIKEIAKDTEDQSTAEKLTKLCDQMTTAISLAVRNLRGHPDALERVMDFLRVKTR